MTYKINGTDLTIQPTSGRWLPQSVLGINGNGVPIYPRVRQFELRWNLTTPDHVSQVRAFFEGIGLSGTAVVDLPQYDAATYTFYAYSGCTLYEPERGQYFTEHTQDLVMIVGSIRT